MTQWQPVQPDSTLTWIRDTRAKSCPNATQRPCQVWILSSPRMSRLKNLSDRALAFKAKLARRTAGTNSCGGSRHKVGLSQQTFNPAFTSALLQIVFQIVFNYIHVTLWSLWSPQGSGGIPLARKLCYAVGGVPYQMTAVAIGVSLQIFLLDVVQVTTTTRFYWIVFENVSPIQL